MTSPLRLFIAADLPASAQREIVAALDAVRAAGGAGLPGWRLVAPAAIHLTLRFLGDTAGERIAAATAALERSAAMSAPLNLSLGPGGTFGGRRARVLWIGLEGQIERLERLAGLLNEQLAVEGWDPPDRPLRPHITLGRARRSATREQAEAGRRVAAQVETSDRTFAVSSIRLIHSTLTPGGAQYSTLATAELGAAVP